MKYRLLQWLACPSCRSTDLRLETVKARTVPASRGYFEPNEDVPGVDLELGEEQEILEGALHCSLCAAVYAIRDGIPRMMLADTESGPPSRHYETQLDASLPEWEQQFNELASPLAPPDFLGKLVLDAGCGFGRHLFFAARYGAEVIGLDSSEDGVESAKRNTNTLNRVHIVQGDLHQPPFREGCFDLTYAYGVLHHVPDPLDAFKVLGTTLKAGGRISLFVYGPRQGMTLAINNAIRGITKDLSAENLETFSRSIARSLRLFSHTPYRLLQHIPIAKDAVSHLPVHDHHQWPFDVVVADIYDRLRVPVTHWFTGEELEGLLADDGYVDVQVTRRVRNNETFRATGIRR